MIRTWLALAALSGLSAVIVGALASHGLQSVLTREKVDWVDTAARYQMMHALALLAVAWIADRRGGVSVHIAGSAFVLGTLLFSGGLYLAALAETTFHVPIVPIGGSLFVVGWLSLFVTALGRWPR